MKWYQLTDAPLQIHGLAVKEGKKFFRLPEEMMDQVNPRIPRLATYPAGGRIRFRTDSPVIEMRYSVTALPLHGHSAGILGRAGAACYVNGIMRGNRPKDLTSALLIKQVQKENEMQEQLMEASASAVETAVPEVMATEEPLPQPIPEVTAQPTPLPTPEPTPIPVVEYVICPGDTLISICKSHYGDEGFVRKVCEANDIANPDNICIGQKIVLP